MEPRAAIRKTLADYLATELATSHPDFEISPSWPTPQKRAPNRAITIVSPVEPMTRWYVPEVHQTTPNQMDPTQGTAEFTYGIFELDLQMDVWSEFEAVRDDIVDRLRVLLNRPAIVTIGQTAMPTLGISPYLVLTATDFFAQLVDYRFESQPRLTEAPGTVMGADWRAIYEGTATMRLADTAAVAVVRKLTVSGALDLEINAP